jgi:hypothetical protein
MLSVEQQERFAPDALSARDGWQASGLSPALVHGLTSATRKKPLDNLRRVQASTASGDESSQHPTEPPITAIQGAACMAEGFIEVQTAGWVWHQLAGHVTNVLGSS